MSKFSQKIPDFQGGVNSHSPHQEQFLSSHCFRVGWLRGCGQTLLKQVSVWVPWVLFFPQCHRKWPLKSSRVLAAEAKSFPRQPVLRTNFPMLQISVSRLQGCSLGFFFQFLDSNKGGIQSLLVHGFSYYDYELAKMCTVPNMILGSWEVIHEYYLLPLLLLKSNE